MFLSRLLVFNLSSQFLKYNINKKSKNLTYRRED